MKLTLRQAALRNTPIYPLGRCFQAMCILILGIYVCGAWTSAMAEDAVVREGRIRAATMYYLSRFVRWPTDVVATKDSTIKICVLGEDSSTEFFEATFQGKMIGEHTLSVAPITFTQDMTEFVAKLQTCEMLYFGEVAAKDIRRVLEAVKELPILTVSGTEDITQIAGGIVYLFVEANKLRIKINYQTSVEAKLKISAELLNVAVVTP